MDPVDVVYRVCGDYVIDALPESSEYRARILGWIRARDVSRLANATSLLGGTLQCVESFRVLRQVEAFFKKNRLFSDDVRCLAQAIDGFKAAERVCAETNARLEMFHADPESYPEFRGHIQSMRTFLARVMGSERRLLKDFPSYVRVTSGATSTRPRSQSHPRLKVRKRLVAPVGCWPYLASLAHLWGYGELTLKPTNLNRVEFVPKNWKTHRTIACEPDGALPLQLACDQYLKERLWQRAGINLWDQSRNQLLAKDGSIDGCFATIDLQAASDTVAYNTVLTLLPEGWFSLLDSFRSSFYRLQGEPPEKYQKFSSMGNGATFVLETLIFAAACNAVSHGIYSVYGDDIIIGAEDVPELTSLLQFLGFTINQEKSFTQGPFRESCGADWFDGVNVTPFYVRDWGTSKALLSHNVNGLVAIGKPGGRLWERCRMLTTSYDLLRVPYNGDSISGVWVDPHTAWTRKLIKQRYNVCKGVVCEHVPNYLGYSYREETKDVGARTEDLFLWFLEKNHQKPKKPAGRRILPSLALSEAISGSRSTTLNGKFVRKRVMWHPPLTGTPAHVYS